MLMNSFIIIIEINLTGKVNNRLFSQNQMVKIIDVIQAAETLKE